MMKKKEEQEERLTPSLPPSLPPSLSPYLARPWTTTALCSRISGRWKAGMLMRRFDLMGREEGNEGGRESGREMGWDGKGGVGKGNENRRPKGRKFKKQEKGRDD